MSAHIGVIDYGLGNLYSVSRAFEHSGATVEVSDDPRKLLTASGLVLPGVGAFADGMRGLQAKGLDKTVVEYIASGRPLLGICLGMQLLAGVGEEFGVHAGLDIIGGTVRRIASRVGPGAPHKIPHVGWMDLQAPRGADEWRGTILDGLRQGQAVYVTHSYEFQPVDEQHRLANYRSQGFEVTAAIKKGNVSGVQFHPEKSGAVGLHIVANFIRSTAGPGR